MEFHAVPICEGEHKLRIEFLVIIPDEFQMRIPARESFRIFANDEFDMLQSMPVRFLGRCDELDISNALRREGNRVPESEEGDRPPIDLFFRYEDISDQEHLLEHAILPETQASVGNVIEFAG